ncbi:hypothetical protein [Micromonospora sp. NPDC049282]|uniref:hypothetical protein n=1 Tax=Micromonospora sp. NPDC049282 TaxID=3364269 RepID=UPI00371923B1
MSAEPIELAAALARFDQLWSPRIVTTVNDYDVRIAKVAGEHVWHSHDHTDEFFLVLDGELRIALRDGADGGQREVTLPRVRSRPESGARENAWPSRVAAGRLRP